MPAWSTALAIGLGAAGSIGSAVIGSKAADKAGQVQADAANQSAILQKQAADDALAFQKQVWETTQKNQQPFLAAGQTAVGQLSGMTGPNGELLKGFDEKFTAPTGLTMQNDPGYRERLALGQQALERSAAARGGVLSGGTAKALNRYAQDYASSEYDKIYNRSMGEYENRFNIFNSNQGNKFNRLAALAGVGQTTAAQLGQAGQRAGENSGNILVNTAGNIGNTYQNAAAARASSYLDSAGAWGIGLNSITGNLQDALLKNR